MGCAFYGIASETQQGFYKNGGGVGCDNPATLKQKVDHCYDNGYGGVMIWELGYDKNLSTTPDLLSAIWEANELKGGYTDIREPSMRVSLQVYPNPATDRLHVVCRDAACHVSTVAEEYVMYNSMGQIVLQGKLQDSTINVQSLPNGMYYLKISDKTAKVMIHNAW